MQYLEFQLACENAVLEAMIENIPYTVIGFHNGLITSQNEFGYWETI